MDRGVLVWIPAAQMFLLQARMLVYPSFAITFGLKASAEHEFTFGRQFLAAHFSQCTKSAQLVNKNIRMIKFGF